MTARIDEVEEGIYRLSVLVPDIAPPLGFTFNSFLVDGDEPLLFHAGQRAMFPLFSDAVRSIMPLDRLRWISFGHVEADECGAMNLWLAAAPNSQVAHGETACSVSLNDLADRPPRALADGELICEGCRRIRFIATPHVPHGWEAGVVFEERSRLLFCGDLFTQLGDDPTTSGDIVTPAMAAEDLFQATSLGPATAPTIRRLAELEPRMLALMHGPTFRGDGAKALRELADRYAARLKAADEPAPSVQAGPPSVAV
ncbi:MBL fold metallo-hydrolase [Sphingosinicella sp. CPCC 101087]|uniref:MBL fold metallo-hydrolase n=1 Tax=Sphingosinicella sp. CPCC 101087 TaxID=2497754 RepID=UPI00101DDD84|nr:MBL fold metallo-hydrolase [Sphingosinicella sp. CPCC 101087]